MERAHDLAPGSRKVYGHYLLQPVRLVIAYEPLLVKTALGRQTNRQPSERLSQELLLSERYNSALD